MNAPLAQHKQKNGLKHRLKRWLHTYSLYEIALGLKATAKQMLSPNVTVQYPEEETPSSPRFRGVVALRRYPNGEERCIACKLCEVICPAAAITIDSEVRADGSRRTTRYDVDVFKCINCGFCEEACPVDSIVLTPEMHYHIDERGQNILTKERLLAIGDQFEAQLAADREEDADAR